MLWSRINLQPRLLVETISDVKTHIASAHHFWIFHFRALGACQMLNSSSKVYQKPFVCLLGNLMVDARIILKCFASRSWENTIVGDSKQRDRSNHCPRKKEEAR